MVIVCLIIFGICWLIQIRYTFIFFKAAKQLFHNNNAEMISSIPSQGVSIIVCGKNEANHLLENIPAICQQQYNLFEVIFVNDKSTDNTYDVIQPLLIKFPHLVYVKNENKNKWLGKKSALDYGISQAKYDAILVTDADCKPSNSNWIQSIMSNYNNNIVIGYGPYFIKNSSLLSKWVQWETMHTFIQYSSYTFNKSPYMCVGRNMLFSKDIYNKAVANTSFLNTYTSIPSGDDDLLLQEMSNYGNVVVATVTNCFPYSLPPSSWQQYWHQKARHTSTGKYYHPAIKKKLGIYGLSHGIFYLLSVFFISLLIIKLFTSHLSEINNTYFIIIGVLIIIKLLCTAQLFQKFYYHLEQLNITKYQIILGDFFWSIYNLILSPYILIKNQQKWKF